MYVRDHARPEFHKALGMDPTTYDYEVFRITSEISKQVFPVTLGLDHPGFQAGLERLRDITKCMAAARAAGGIGGKLPGIGLSLAAAGFARLYALPAKRNAAPDEVRLVPAL